VHAAFTSKVTLRAFGCDLIGGQSVRSLRFAHQRASLVAAMRGGRRSSLDEGSGARRYIGKRSSLNEGSNSPRRGGKRFSLNEGSNSPRRGGKRFSLNEGSNSPRRGGKRRSSIVEMAQAGISRVVTPVDKRLRRAAKLTRSALRRTHKLLDLLAT
jgi:hypothetical protein